MNKYIIASLLFCMLTLRVSQIFADVITFKNSSYWPLSITIMGIIGRDNFPEEERAGIPVRNIELGERFLTQTEKDKEASKQLIVKLHLEPRRSETIYWEKYNLKSLQVKVKRMFEPNKPALTKTFDKVSNMYTININNQDQLVLIAK